MNGETPTHKGVAMSLRLYIAGNGPNSMQAIANANAICRDHYPAALMEVIDVLEKPALALADGVIVTPTLIRLSPPPARKIIGNLSETTQVLVALGAR
jgi:circadian clock protein KaiB